MSGRLVSAVFDSALPAWLKHYAAAAASFASDDGRRIFPSMAHLARLAGRSERATQTAVHELVRLGVLTVVVPPGRYRPTHYRFHAAALPSIHDPAQLPLFPTGISTTFSTSPIQKGWPNRKFAQVSTAMGEAHFTPWVKPTSPDPSVDPSRTGTRYNARARKCGRQTPESESVMIVLDTTPTYFEVDGPPAVKGSTFSFFYRGRIVTKQDAKNLTSWAAQVAWCAKQAGLARIPKGVGVIVSVTYEFAPPIRVVRSCPCTRPDIDKLARALLDALTGVAYEDDGQVVALTVRKTYGTDTRTRVWVDRA